MSVLDKLLGGVLLLGGWMAVLTVVSGLVTKLLWGWFAVPLGAPEMSLPIAIGIGILIARFTVKSESLLEDHSNETDEEKGNRILNVFVSPFFYNGFALLFGWLTHFFV